MVFKKGQIPVNKIEVDIELMKKLYFVDKWDYRKIADYFGFKSISPIYDRFKKYNLVARSNIDLKTGFKHSQETKDKISKSGIGRKVSKEERLRMSLYFKGKNNPMYGKYGALNPNYKGGHINKNGYKQIYVHGKIILEHRYIWIKKIGKIPKGYTVHHVNGNKIDNRIENLRLITNSEHGKLHYNKRKIDKSGRFCKM